MTRKFVVAVDGSDHGWKALDLASELAHATGAELIILHVVPRETVPQGLEAYARAEGIPLDELRAQYRLGKRIGDRITREAETRARRHGPAGVSTRIAEGKPAEEIVALAEAEGADMIFLGSRGFGDAKALLLGSVSHRVMQLAPCSCVAVK